MPLARGVDREKAIIGYVNALAGLPIEAIAHGIRRFLRGDTGDLSPKFCPHPPELATFIRAGMRDIRSDAPRGSLYGYHPPNSRRLERSLTKERARQLIDGGVHPRGSIWCPGEIGNRPDIGDLFAPDDDWKGPWLLPQWQPGKEAA